MTMTMRATTTDSKQSGFSLVELMVAMVLGIMLLAGAVAIYLAAKRSYVEVEQVAALSENANFAQQMIEDSLRHAGFFGEVKSSQVQDPASSGITVVDDCANGASATNLSQFVYAAKTDDNNFKPCITDAYVPASGFVNDVLVIKHVLPRPLLDSPRVAPPKVHDPATDNGTIDYPSGLDKTKIYVMTNSVSGRMFYGKDTQPTITVGGEFPNGSAWEYQYEVFYISKDPNTDKPPQLSRRVIVQNGTAMQLQSEELTEGVENLRLMFGFDDNNDGEVDRYTNAAGVTDWSQVDSVEVYMLVRSATTDEQFSDQKTYQVGDTAVTPLDSDDKDDRKYRRLLVFTSVSLRNLQLIIRGGA